MSKKIKKIKVSKNGTGNVWVWNFFCELDEEVRKETVKFSKMVPMPTQKVSLIKFMNVMRRNR